MEIILFIHFYPPKYAHGRSLRHILDKITKWHFLRTSNEVIWPKNFLNSMHGLKSAILAILQEIRRLAGMARGIPRPSILEVPAFFALLEPRGIDSINLRILEVLAKVPRGPRKLGDI